ncbi:MAG: type II toxin-antitoxin system HicB family antitoxin [Melioribacteraceae bacterium]
MQFNAIIEKDKNGYFAYIPELKGCYSQGDSFEEALINIREAAEVYVESLDDEEKKEIKNKSFFIAPINVQPLKVV